MTRELSQVCAQRDILVSARPGPCTIPLCAVDGGTITLAASRLGELALPTHTLAFSGGYFDDADRWRCANDRMEVIAFHADEGFNGLEAWVVRSPGPVAIARWVDGGFEDSTVVGDGAGVFEPTDWPEDEIVILGDLLYVTGPDLSVTNAFLGVDAEDRAVALVVITG